MKKFALLFAVLFFNLHGVGCKSDPEGPVAHDDPKFEASVELYVFKTDNVALRAAIRENTSFNAIKFIGDDHDYSITLVAEADTKVEAETILNEVKNFALEWGAANPNYFHPDDGTDHDGNPKYKTIIESSVKLLPIDS